MQLKLKGLLVMQTVEIIVKHPHGYCRRASCHRCACAERKSAGLGSAFGNDTTALGQARNAKRAGKQKLQRLTVIFASVLGVLALVLLVIG